MSCAQAIGKLFLQTSGTDYRWKAYIFLLRYQRMIRWQQRVLKISFIHPDRRRNIRWNHCDITFEIRATKTHCMGGSRTNQPQNDYRQKITFAAWPSWIEAQRQYNILYFEQQTKEEYNAIKNKSRKIHNVMPGSDSQLIAVSVW